MSLTAGPGHNRKPAGGGRVYAIAFDFDTEMLETLYPNPSRRNAYSDVRGFLEENGFEHRQGSVYFGDDDLTATECIAIVEDMADEFSCLRRRFAISACSASRKTTILWSSSTAPNDVGADEDKQVEVSPNGKWRKRIGSCHSYPHSYPQRTLTMRFWLSVSRFRRAPSIS